VFAIPVIAAHMLKGGRSPVLSPLIAGGAKMLGKGTWSYVLQHSTLVPILCAATIALLPHRGHAGPIRDCEQLKDSPLAIRAC
jgi:hypothetical protein